MAPKMTKMLIKVDLQCLRCCNKIKKILCRIPQIRDQIYDERQNTVLITVVCCSPENIRQKIICKGGETVQSVEILHKKVTFLLPAEDTKPPAPTPVPAPLWKTPKPAPPKPLQQVPSPPPLPVPNLRVQGSDATRYRPDLSGPQSPRPCEVGLEPLWQAHLLHKLCNKSLTRVANGHDPDLTLSGVVAIAWLRLEVGDGLRRNNGSGGGLG